MSQPDWWPNYRTWVFMLLGSMSMFPAQEIHFRLDQPQAAADVVWVNDLRLGKEGAREF
jgi:hypothetical protein